MVRQSRARGPGGVFVLLALAFLASACGVGAVEESTFALGAMQSATGGTVELGAIRLVIPPGALPADAAVGIVPEPTPLPIQAAAGDNATYTHLGPQWCCGPTGLALLADAHLRVTYDPTTLPAGVAEDDLVLLLWDPSLGALVPLLAPGVQDLDDDLFLVSDYRLLGHVAIGIREVTAAGIAFLTAPGPLGLVAQTLGDGLYVAPEDGSSAPVALPSNGVRPDRFCPSPAGDRLLFEYASDTGQFGGLELWSVGLEDTAATLLAGVDEEVTSYDPAHGWLRGGQDVFFTAYVPGGPAGGPGTYTFDTVDGLGSAPGTALHELGTYAYVQDVRQSPDGAAILIVYYDSSESLTLDVIEAATGVLLSSGDIPYGGGQASPRFLPDSTGLYLVRSDASGVDRYDLDGSGPTPLFDLPVAQGTLKDFVLAPDGDDYAYVAWARAVALGAPGTAQVAPANDALYVGSLSEGARGVNDLGEVEGYAEMLFHPSGEHVFLDGYASGLRMFAATDGAAAAALPVGRISQLDISRDDGRLLLVVGAAPLGFETASTAQTLGPGLYVAQGDGTQIQAVPLPSGFQVAEGRWLRTIRTAPCMGFTNLVR